MESTKPPEENAVDKEKNSQSAPLDGHDKDTQDPAGNQENSEEINWKRMREARAAERREFERIKREKELETERANRQAEMIAKFLEEQKKKGAEKEDDPFAEEQQKFQERVTAEVLSEIERREKASIPERLRQAYPDFDEVCSPENLDMLSIKEDTLCKYILNYPDSFDKWRDVYAATKKMLKSAASPTEKARAEKNADKPTAVAAPTATARAPEEFSRILTEEKRKANWNRMMKTIRGG